MNSGSWWGSIGSDHELADCKPGAWHAPGAEGRRGLELWGHGEAKDGQRGASTR